MRTGNPSEFKIRPSVKFHKIDHKYGYLDWIYAERK